jgi:hypothetical protein
MKTSLLVLGLFVGFLGCGNDAPDPIFEVIDPTRDQTWFVDGNVSASARRIDDTIELTLQRLDRGESGVADSGGNVTLVLGVAETALVEGATISVRGVTTYENVGSKASAPPRNDVWVEDTDVGVGRALLYAQCFCDAESGEASQRFDLQLRVDAIGERFVGQLEGQVEGGAGLSIGPTVFDVVGSFDVRIE